jgi:uncharacterized lipoprotein YddW (UPF0748 family)
MLISVAFYSVTVDDIRREIRAVWVATNFRLDWPPHTYNQEKQKEELLNIFNNINRKKLNTIYFQVRSNGTSMFSSTYEPFSPYFTGQVGKAPSYDPLELAIQIAHKRGLELHAWINVFRCFTGSEENILIHPDHVYNKHPEWILNSNYGDKKELWLDPGLPEVRNYLVNLIIELVSNYDIDGIHLDFIRYPDNNVNDDFSYNLYGENHPRDSWRRDNVTKFLESLYYNIRTIKPFVKIGVAPFGIYKNIPGASGTEGYSIVYQDTREWLRLSYIDYAVPQIYWNMKENPQFDKLADDWIKNSYGKNIVLGVGAYKNEIKVELSKYIEYAREINSSGVSFFRYSNIKDINFSSYDTRSYPTTLPQFENLEPLSPINLTYDLSDEAPQKVTLKWDLSDHSKNFQNADYYALYKLLLPDEELSEKNLYEIFKAEKNTITLHIETPKQLKYYFVLKSVDKFWNESIKSSNTIEVIFPSLLNFINKKTILSSPILIKNEKSYKLLVSVENKEKIEVIGVNESIRKVLLQNTIKPGKNIFSIDNNLSTYKELYIKYKTSGREERLNLTQLFH